MQPSASQYPARLTQEALYPLAYRYMYLSQVMEGTLLDLFRKGLVKGTVTLGLGNEATAVGMALPLRPSKDIVSLLHRDLISHCILGMSVYKVFCQYNANAESPTHGREGNVHHGSPQERRLPMMSHLGSMLSPTVGAVHTARKQGEDVFGVTVIGDGGASTGDFHESLNIASVLGVPVLFLIENNAYAFSTPLSEQYRCERLSLRAGSYGVQGRTIDGTDVWEVYRSVCDAFDEMARTSLPYILECDTLRLNGHAAYDKADYVTPEEHARWMKREPVARARKQLAEACGWSEEKIQTLEAPVRDEVAEAAQKACSVARPTPQSPPWEIFAAPETSRVEPYRASGLTNQRAVTAALDYILSREPSSFIMGLDVGEYGSAFKTCKGLHERYGRERVMNMPLSESGIVGFSLGASQMGGRPIVEFQFADFVTEAVTQLGLNCGTWYFRSGNPAPVVFRLPCGGGVTLGAFHSGEFDGLLSRFPGIKLLYPVTPQETFEALVAAFYDPNPCAVLEHKLLYTRSKGDVDFNSDLQSVWSPRRHREGDELTVVAFGAMVQVAVEAAQQCGRSADIWNPFVLNPVRADEIVRSAERTGHVIVVQESGAGAGLADRFVSLLSRSAFEALKKPPVVVSAPDTPVPFAPELESHYRPSVDRVCAAMARILGDRA